MRKKTPHLLPAGMQKGTTAVEENLAVHRKTVFVLTLDPASLFAKAKDWKQPKCQSTGD
jgi:hypothetical protein